MKLRRLKWRNLRRMYWGDIEHPVRIEAMLVAEALWNRATQALKDRPEPPQWKALRQTKDMMGGDWGIGNAA